MDVDKEILYLEDLVRDPSEHLSEIMRIYLRIAEDGSSAASISAVPNLNKLAVHLLSPEVISILKKHRLDAFSYMLVANNLLDVDNVKDDLENGNVLMTTAPANTIRKLKVELGVASAVAKPTAAPATQTAAQALSAPFDKLQSSSIDQAGLHTDGNRVALEIKNQCKDMTNLNGMILYKLPLEATSPFSGAASIVRRFCFGEPSSLLENKPWKTILLMGATGSGKTTMINAMINYVLDVRWEDPFRFILIEEKEISQAFSQTRDVTAYDIHHRNGFRVPFSLTIVDTPGFGDTEGSERDKEITSAIKKFFENENGIQELDVVAFTVQSSLARLTSSQKFIFKSVLSIFGNDVAENVRFLVTFADGRRPVVLEAIKQAKLPCLKDDNGDPYYQKFNNGEVFALSQAPGDQFSLINIEWDNVMHNFKSFFSELYKMPTKSLQLTKEVLNEREILQHNRDNLNMTIEKHIMKVEELQMIKKSIAQYEDDVNANKDFGIPVKVPKKKQIPVDVQTAFNCSKCEITCHYPCHPKLWTGFCPAFWRSEKLDRKPTKTTKLTSVVEATLNAPLSLVIWGDNDCKICPEKCAKELHSNEDTRWIYVQEEEIHTLYDIRKKYDEAKDKTLSAEELKNALEEEMKILKGNIFKAMEDIIQCSQFLNKMALLVDDNPISQFIKQKIEKEEKEKKPGHIERIQFFQELLQEALSPTRW